MFALEEPDDEVPATDAFAVLAGRPQQQLVQAIQEVRSILSGPSIQARCLECPAPVPATIRSRDLSLLDLLEEWLS
jgi:protease-4